MLKRILPSSTRYRLLLACTTFGVFSAAIQARITRDAYLRDHDGKIDEVPQGPVKGFIKAKELVNKMKMKIKAAETTVKHEYEDIKSNINIFRNRNNCNNHIDNDHRDYESPQILLLKLFDKIHKAKLLSKTKGALDKIKKLGENNDNNDKSITTNVELDVNLNDTNDYDIGNTLDDVKDNVLNNSMTPSSSSSSSSSSMKRRKINLVLIGDSLVSGVGCTNATGPILPRYIASILSVNLNTDVTWSAHGLVGGTVKQMRQQILPKIQKELNEVKEKLLHSSNSIHANISCNNGNDDEEINANDIFKGKYKFEFVKEKVQKWFRDIRSEGDDLLNLIKYRINFNGNVMKDDHGITEIKYEEDVETMNIFVLIVGLNDFKTIFTEFPKGSGPSGFRQELSSLVSDLKIAAGSNGLVFVPSLPISMAKESSFNQFPLKYFVNSVAYLWDIQKQNIGYDNSNDGTENSSSNNDNENDIIDNIPHGTHNSSHSHSNNPNHSNIGDSITAISSAASTTIVESYNNYIGDPTETFIQNFTDEYVSFLENQGGNNSHVFNSNSNSNSSSNSSSSSNINDSTGSSNLPLPLSLPLQLISTDGIHPSAAGYRLWACHLASSIIDNIHQQDEIRRDCNE